MYRIFSRFPEETGKWQPSNGEKLAATYPNIDPFLYITISDKLKNNIGRITYSAQRIVDSRFLPETGDTNIQIIL